MNDDFTLINNLLIERDARRILAATFADAILKTRINERRVKFHRDREILLHIYRINVDSYWTYIRNVPKVNQMFYLSKLHR